MGVVVMGTGSMLIPALQQLLKNLESMCQDVPVQLCQCKRLAEIVTGLTPLFDEIQRLTQPLTEQTINTFRALMHAVIEAQQVLKKIQECLKMRLVFQDETYAGHLSKATMHIWVCLSSLPLVQLGISADMQDEIKLLNAKLGELGIELKETKSLYKDQQVLQDEIMKEEAMLLREIAEFKVENDGQLEEDLLQILVDVNEEEQRDILKTVSTYISLLTTNKSMQILRSLKELKSLASFPKGQVKVFEEGGIPEITNLLKEKDTLIAENAAGVLEALTFDIKGSHGESLLPSEQRDQISSAVTDNSLGDLIDLMLTGSTPARLKAAQTVINILANEDVRAEVSLQIGVVSAFFELTRLEEGLKFPDEGKLLSLKGLNLLSGEKATDATEECDLPVAFLRLAASEVNPQVVQESLLALRLLSETGWDNICHTMLANRAIPFLVGSVSRLPIGRGREDALKLLNDMSKLDGMPEVIVRCEPFYHLLPVLNEANFDGYCANEATRLLNTCLSSVRRDISHVLSQSDLRGLISLLGIGQTSVTSKVDILFSFEYLCRESLPLQVAFLDSAGVATLVLLVKSFEMVEIKDGVARLMKVLASFPSCHKDICNQGGMQLLYSLLVEDSLRCCTEAVVAAESLMSGPKSSDVSLDGFPFQSVVSLLAPTYELECRESAAGVFSVLASRNSDVERHWDRQSIGFLVDMVRPDSDLPITARKKAAEVLLEILRKDMSFCSYIVGEDDLQSLIDFELLLATETKDIVIQLLITFCKADSNSKQAVVQVGGPVILLEALEKGNMKEEVAVALGHLVESAPAREAVLQAGFIERAVKCFHTYGGNQLSVELIRALVAVLDTKEIASSIRQADGVQALLSVLEGRNDTGKKVAAVALTKLIRLDQDSSAILGLAGGISSIYKFLVLQESEGAEPHDLEALEALTASAEEQSNKSLIVEEEATPLLISIAIRGAPKAQELALAILLNLSREGDICGTLMKDKICTRLFDIVRPQSELSVTEKAVGEAIAIIRNLSLSGNTARMAMLEEGDGAIRVLLDRIRHHDADPSTEAVRLAVIALQMFMSSSKGRIVFIREGGIQVIVQVLQYRMGNGQAKNFATKILVMVAQDSEASKEVCHAIFDANVIPGLRDILELGPTPECRLQACTLLKFLMYSGPRVAVCRHIREEDCIPLLLELRSNAVCHTAAGGALDQLKMYDKESRKLIREAERDQSWSKSA